MLSHYCLYCGIPGKYFCLHFVLLLCMLWHLVLSCCVISKFVHFLCVVFSVIQLCTFALNSFALLYFTSWLLLSFHIVACNVLSEFGLSRFVVYYDLSHCRQCKYLLLRCSRRKYVFFVLYFVVQYILNQVRCWDQFCVADKNSIWHIIFTKD